MNLLAFLAPRRSAPAARERLQLLLAHERVMVGTKSDLVTLLREEILGVIARHVTIDRDKVRVRMDPGQTVSMLEVDIEIPTAPSGEGRIAAAS